jgi:hypothetical protein
MAPAVIRLWSGLSVVSPLTDSILSPGLRLAVGLGLSSPVGEGETIGSELSVVAVLLLVLLTEGSDCVVETMTLSNGVGPGGWGLLI